MKIPIRFEGALLTLAAVLAFGSLASAQTAFEGRFVLPIDVQWSGGTLTAGEYHFVLSPQSLGGLLHIRDARGQGKMLTTAR